MLHQSVTHVKDVNGVNIHRDARGRNPSKVSTTCALCCHSTMAVYPSITRRMGLVANVGEGFEVPTQVVAQFVLAHEGFGRS